MLRGERVGPTLYISGPVIAGPPDQAIVWSFRALIAGGLLAVGAVAWLVRWGGLRLQGRQEDARKLRRLLLPGAAALGVLALGLIWARVIPLNAYTSLQFPFAFVPETEERAREEVRRQARGGFDLIKVYDFMPEEQYLGAIDEASARGIYVMGHLDHGLEAPLAAGLREIAHVDELIDEHLVGESSPREFVALPMNLEAIPASVATVARYDALVVSNLSMDVITYEYLDQGPEYFARPEYAVIRPAIVREWLGSRMVRWQGQQDWRRDIVQPFLDAMVRNLHDAGVPVLTGTDTGAEGGVPAHIHRELELLVRVGLTPFEALSAATTNANLAVRRMGLDDMFGQVVPGYRADLLLLEANPLEDVGATRQRMGVMARGQWYTRAELDRLVGELVASY